MKHSLTLIIATLFCIPVVAIGQSKNNPLVGTWRLISTVGKNSSGGTWNQDSSKIYQVKVITPSRFVFTTYDPKADTLMMSAQGPITVGANAYTELIEKSTMKSMNGKTFKYTSTVKGNRWHIEGGNDILTLVEDWIKVE
jgi:hypothetical protein